MKLLIVFIVLNILNVVLQTVKAICTIKCNKLTAAIINAVAFGLYTIVLVYMNCDLTTGVKALVVAFCNLIGVYVVKTMEERFKKDKIWKIEFSTLTKNEAAVIEMCEKMCISYNYSRMQSFNYYNVEYTTFNFYCPTQEDTEKAHEIIDTVGGKYFITETKSF